MQPRITVGIPVYRGKSLVQDVLQSIIAQTFGDFRVVLSIDGADQHSADACRPYLQDRRFSMTVQHQQLGWAGNINWLARQVQTEFFVYISQDDRIAPTYYEKLIGCADQNPGASIFYSDVQWFGGKSGIMRQSEKVGSGFERMASQLQDCLWFPFLGLRRAELLTSIDELKVDHADSALEDVIWVTRALQTSDLKRVPEALFYKRFHAGMVTVGKSRWSPEHARAVWLDAWSRMVIAALKVATTPGQVKTLLGIGLRRVAVSAPDMDWFYKVDHLRPDQRRQLVIEFIDHLIGTEPRLAERIDQARSAILDWALGEVFGLSPPRALSQLDKRVRFRLDQAIVGAGWHGVEQDPRGESLRWSGPGNKSDLHLPLIIDIDCSIRLHVPFGVPFGLAEAGVSLFVNGIAVKVHLTRNRGGDWTIQAVMRAEQVLEAGPLTVTLNVERMVKPAEFDGSSDTRVLGVPVSWIEVEPA